MKLADLLSRRRVLVPLAADTWEAGIRALLDACVADGRVRDPDKLEAAVRNAWPEDTLSLGPHAVLPHFRTDAVDTVVAALGVAPTAMRVEGKGTEAEVAVDARIMLLILAPPREAAAYLQAVAAFARALAQPDVVNGLHAARTPDEVLALPGLEGVRLEEELLVSDVMSPPSVAFEPELSIEAAARVLVRGGLDAAPVIAPDGVVIGLLSTRELLRYFLPAYVQRVQKGEHKATGRARAAARATAGQVGSVMARNVLCVSEDQSLSDVASLLANKDVACLPVVRDGVLRGVLTRAEIVRKLVGQ